MPAIQNVVLTDRAATPVAHTFTPRDVKDGTGLVVSSAGVPIGERKLTVSMRKSGSKYKGRLTLSVPIVVDETINGVVSPKVARVAVASLDVTFDERSSTLERTNLIGMVADALGTGKVLVHKALVDLEGVYGA